MDGVGHAAARARQLTGAEPNVSRWLPRQGGPGGRGWSEFRTEGVAPDDGGPASSIGGPWVRFVLSDGDGRSGVGDRWPRRRDCDGAAWRTASPGVVPELGFWPLLRDDAGPAAGDGRPGMCYMAASGARRAVRPGPCTRQHHVTPALTPKDTHRWDIVAVRRARRTTSMAQPCCCRSIGGPSLSLALAWRQHRWAMGAFFWSDGDRQACSAGWRADASTGMRPNAWFAGLAREVFVQGGPGRECVQKVNPW